MSATVQPPLLTRRSAVVTRETTETRIQVSLGIDGAGEHAIRTGIGFLDHMLAQVALHGLFDLSVQASGRSGC